MQPTETVRATDGADLAVYAWPVDQPKAVVQIAHGMAEHGGRYDRFARALNDAGYAVYASDHRGHGGTAGSLERMGHFADTGGWSLVVGDLVTVSEHVRRRHPEAPYVLMGHSMGSMLTRAFLQERRAELSGAIISGTAGDPGLLGRAGVLLASIESRLRGPRHRSRIMDKLSFGAYNAAFKPNRTAFDWLSRDEAEVDAYVADPWCGNLHSSRFWVDMLTGLAAINDPAQVAGVPDEVPLLVFSGSKDPVGGSEAADVKKVVRMLREAGVRDLTERYYPEARHETLNETNRDEVTADVIAWLDSRVGAAASAG